MNQLAEHIINTKQEKLKNNLERPSFLFMVIILFKNFIYQVIVETNVSVIRLFKLFIFGIIHFKEDKITGILIGFLNLHLQLTINNNNIYNISILKIFSIGLISNDEHSAYGFIATILGYNFQFMLGIHKPTAPIKPKHKSSGKQYTVIGQA